MFKRIIRNYVNISNDTPNFALNIDETRINEKDRIWFKNKLELTCEENGVNLKINKIKHVYDNVYDFNWISLIGSINGENNYEHDVFVTNRGKLVRILSQKLYEIHRKATAAKEFPIVLDNDTKLEYLGNGEMYAVKANSRDKVTIKYFQLHSQRGLYEPLTKWNDYSDEYPDQKPVQFRDFYIRMPSYDRDGMQAFVFVRYAWGINTSVAYFDEKTNTISCIYLFNDDFPEPVSIKIENNELYVLSTDSLNELIFNNDEICPLNRKNNGTSYGVFDDVEPNIHWSHYSMVGPKFAHLYTLINPLLDNKSIEKYI
jgi:hypothetical protein